jgi:hypothetical protein
MLFRSTHSADRGASGRSLCVVDAPAAIRGRVGGHRRPARRRGTERMDAATAPIFRHARRRRPSTSPPAAPAARSRGVCRQVRRPAGVIRSSCGRMAELSTPRARACRGWTAGCISNGESTARCQAVAQPRPTDLWQRQPAHASRGLPAAPAGATIEREALEHAEADRPRLSRRRAGRRRRRPRVGRERPAPLARGDRGRPRARLGPRREHAIARRARGRARLRGAEAGRPRHPDLAGAPVPRPDPQRPGLQLLAGRGPRPRAVAARERQELPRRYARVGDAHRLRRARPNGGEELGARPGVVPLARAPPLHGAALRRRHGRRLLARVRHVHQTVRRGRLLAPRSEVARRLDRQGHAPHRHGHG